MGSNIVLYSALPGGGIDATPKFGWTLLMIAIVGALGMFLVILVALSRDGSSKEEPPDSKIIPSPVLVKPAVPKLHVENSIRPGVDPNTFEHIIYFTFQEEAELFRFLINDQVVGQGTFDELDIRFAPPYRRVIFITEVEPELPIKVSMESFNRNGILIGEGELVMDKYSYHGKE